MNSKKAHDNEEGIIYVQRRLGVTPDGWWGKNTQEAFDKLFVRGNVGNEKVVEPKRVAEVSPKNEGSEDGKISSKTERVPLSFDERSERNLLTLQPRVEEIARRWLNNVRGLGINMVVICGTRTFEEQQAIYDQGRTKPGKIVSYTRPGRSMHNYGLAWDAVLFVDGKPIWDGEHLEVCGNIASELGIEWGGTWRKFRDSPHYQYTSGQTLDELLMRFPHGYSRK